MSDKPSQVTENMHKFMYLANEYQGSKIEQLFKMFQMPLLDYQAAAYLAEDLGFLTVDQKNKKFEVKALPEDLNTGKEVRELINTLQFVFARLAKDETDLAEWELNSWMEGYPTHDQFIAVKWMLNNGMLATYEVKTKTLKGKVDTYTYYCVSGNEDKKWGRKQFPNQKRLVG